MQISVKKGILLIRNIGDNLMIKVMFKSFFTNLILSVTKVLIGFYGNCSALIADGIASFSDMVTDIIAIISGFFTRKKADKTHPFGYGKVEYLFSLAISLVILYLGVTVILDITHEPLVLPESYVLPFIIVAIIVKFILVKYLNKKAKDLNSDIILASALESKTDVYGSILVFISTILMLLSGTIEIFSYANIVATILIGFLIIKTGFIILKENVVELSESKFSGTLNKEVRDIIHSYKEVERINQLYLFKSGSYYRLLTKLKMHEDIKLSKANEISDDIEKNLKKKNIRYAYIEMDV